MPARTVLFDIKATQTHTFGALPRNFLSYQPQGRLFLLAGFGNISSGLVEIYDLKTRKKLCEFSAPNSTTCEWSPDGRSILTGTLSPRLRVDNGVKVWWCDGTALHTHPIEELYQVSRSTPLRCAHTSKSPCREFLTRSLHNFQVTWRPGPVDSFPAFPLSLPTAPSPSSSVAQHTKPIDTTIAPKPTGAYRPPGARGTLTPSIFKREDEGGGPSPPPGMSNGNGGVGNFGARAKGRQIPGAPPPGLENGNGNGNANASGKNKKGKKGNGMGAGSSVPPIELEPVVVVEEEVLDPEVEGIQKKIRNLSKKVSTMSFLVFKQVEYSF